jgi:hypothetical protein
VSVLVRFPPSNVTKDQYEAVRGALNDGGNWPADGCQLHVAFGDDQDVRVSEIWESREKFEAFGQTLRPELEKAGIQLSGQPEFYEVVQFDTF